MISPYFGIAPRMDFPSEGHVPAGIVRTKVLIK